MKSVRHQGIETFLPEKFSDSFELIRGDYFRYTGSLISPVFKLWLKHFSNSGMGFLFYFRLCQRRGVFYPYFRLRLEKYIRKYALQIPLSVPVGKGLYLGHGVSIIVNGSAVIGSNVNLSQFVTIGSNKGSAALIEDNVYIGPSVCTIERVRIGHGSMVGAGAVVTSDVPPNHVVAGVPSKVIRENAGYEPANRL